MADDITLPGTGSVVATDDVGSKHYQIVKVALGAADAVDMHLDSGQQTMANSAPVAIASNQSAVPVSGTVTASNTAGDIAHDSADSGNPVKVGGRAVNVFAAVANNDRSDLKTDLQGRALVARYPVDTFWSVNRTFTAAQTGTVLKTPGSGKKLVVTKLILGTYGTTAGRCIVFFDDDTTFTQDTDQVLAAASFAPSSTSKPGLVDPAETPCLTADFSLRITTDTAMSVDVTVQGYEI